jgi:23S rRNA (cytidine2498-2'-O)-methyltransferase
MNKIDLSKARVFLAPEGFEKELQHEIVAAGGKVLAQKERLLISAPFVGTPVWARCEWLNSVWIPSDSIGMGAKGLAKLNRRTALYSAEFHRRAELIQEQVSKRKTAPVPFLGDLPEKKYGAWSLWDKDLILAAATTSSPWPLGEFEFQEDRESSPSRAYLKLWEVFTCHIKPPKINEYCLDLGACPGGWTWVLSELGCEVLAIDRSELAPEIASRENVEFRKQSAFAIEPKDVPKVDWLFSDLICYPDRLFKYLEKWRALEDRPNFVCTLKFQGPTDFDAIRAFQAIPGSKVIHLVHNKHEVTWICPRANK